MNLFHRFHILILIATLLTSCDSCTESDKSKIDTLQKEVFKIHDEVMPRIDEIMTLKGKISGRIDSLEKLSPLATTVANNQLEGIRINQALTEADSLMDEWMANYNSDTLKGMTETKAEAYLTREKEKISTVQLKINNSIEHARKYLQISL